MLRDVEDGPRRPLFALGLMLLATASFVGMQAVVKLARLHGLSASEVMFFRTAPGLPLLWWSMRRKGLSLRPDKPSNMIIRSLFGSVAMATNFTSMRVLSLAQFSTLGLAQPVFIALIAPVLLRERVRLITWLAMALALAGALVLLSPNVNARPMPSTAAALGLTSALASAFAMIWVRKATENDPAERVVFHFALWVSAGSLLVGLAHGAFLDLGTRVSLAVFLLEVLGMSLFGTLGQLLMTNAYLYGEATSVSLVGYSGVLLSMLLDLLLWQVAPARSALLGTALMAAAALLILRARRS